MVEKILDIVVDWNPDVIAIDARSPAAVIAPTLLAAEIAAEMGNTTTAVLAAGAFLDAVDAGTLSHADQQVLNDGAVSAVKRDLAGGFAFDRAPGSIYLVAASLALWSLLSATTAAPKKTPLPMMDTSGADFRDEPFKNLDKVPF